MTFLDNHDQNWRFFYRDPRQPDAYEDQVSLGVGCLFSLPGIPCLYYGTEQGLSGGGSSSEWVRQALWGKPDAFSQNSIYFQAIQRLSLVRDTQPALRYGRSYSRPISGDGVHFGISTLAPGILSFSRILSDQEVLIVANTSTQNGWAGAVLGDRVDASIILIIVLLSNLLNFVQTYRSQKAVDKLRSSVAPTATALRDGKWIEIPRSNLMPGDMIRLTAGDLVPADARLVQTTDLQVQQAALTGESQPVEKTADDAYVPTESLAEVHNRVFLGTSVMSGSATASPLRHNFSSTDSFITTNASLPSRLV